MFRFLRPQDRFSLRELDLAVRNDVEPVAPRIAHLVTTDARATFAGRCDDSSDVVNDEPEVAVLAPWLELMLKQGHELVAEVDEGHRPRLAAQLQLGEKRTPEI